MTRLWPALAVLVCGVARGAAPSYSAAGIVSSASNAAAFAPNSLATVYGDSLAIASHGVTTADIVENTLPTELISTRVYVEYVPAPLLYVSDHQVNFLMPARQAVGPVHIRVVREGQYGPEIVVTLADAAPALFPLAPDPSYAIATHADGSLLTPDKPAAPGDLIVVYLAGLGKTDPLPPANEIPHSPAGLLNPKSLRVTLAGVPIDAARVLYAGVTPACAGLYQINLVLPQNASADAEIRVFLGENGSQNGLRLPLRSPAQLSGVAER